MKKKLPAKKGKIKARKLKADSLIKVIHICANGVSREEEVSLCEYCRQVKKAMQKGRRPQGVDGNL